MKKIFYVAVFSLVLFSCGKDKKAEDAKEVVVNTDEYVVTLDAIYEKNDSTYLNVYDQADHDIADLKVYTNVEASPIVQTVEYKIKKGAEFSNVCFSLSTNKEQNTIQIKAVTIKKNGKLIIGGPGDHWDYYFANNDQLVIDMTTGIHKLKHDQIYTAGLVGNDLLKSLLAK